MAETELATDQFERIADFVFNCRDEIPEQALKMASTLLIDTIGIAAGAAKLESGIIARDHAFSFHAAGNNNYAARMMFDGRNTSIPGAAFASATQIDNLDGHDGYNPTKGHIGCAVVPALFAFAEQYPQLSGREALAILVMAYEVSARAALSLHATVPDYHTSGAWNALGVAALGCRLKGSDRDCLRHALGIAEYHGPRSQMMREIDNPTMLHDGSGMGALTGCSAVFLAERGFKGAPAITVEAAAVSQYWQDLGELWTVELNYIKPYPICRWAHAAIDGVRQLMLENNIELASIASIEIRTFEQAARLYAGIPQTTSQAQYSLPYAVATMLRYGKIAPEHIAGSGLKDESVAALLPLIKVVEDERHSSRFPQGRWSDVSITLEDGTQLISGDIHARGGPEAPMAEEEIIEKFHSMTADTIDHNRSKQIWNMRDRLLEKGSTLNELAELIYPAGAN